MTERGARLDGERRLLQVSDVLRAIEDQFSTAFPRRIWVIGSLRALRTATFPIPGAGEDTTDSLDAFVLVEETEHGLRTLPCELGSQARTAIDDTLRRLHDVAVDDLLVEGHYIRVGGLLGYDLERHCAIFEVTALDPGPTAAWLADRREQVRTAASSARLSEHQKDLRVPVAPASVALVAPAGDPALQRAQEILASCGFALDVKVYAPEVAGSAAGDQLANGLREAALAGHDLVLLLRQDGRPLSLAPYDSEAVVRAIAGSPTPILTGLGSPDEPAAAEEVAHQAYPTSDEAAASVVRRLERASSDLEKTVREVADEGGNALRRAARLLEETRLNLAEDFRQAHQRAERVRARRLLRIRLVALVIALAVVAAAVLTTTWLILAALVIPAAIALAAPRLRPQRRSALTVTDISFAQAVAKLKDIGGQLQAVADPDDVLRLEAEADALAEHCRTLLRRPRALRTAAGAGTGAAARPGYPTVGADGSVIGASPDRDTHNRDTQNRDTQNRDTQNREAQEPETRPSRTVSAGQTVTLPADQAGGPPIDVDARPGRTVHLPDGTTSDRT